MSDRVRVIIYFLSASLLLIQSLGCAAHRERSQQDPIYGRSSSTMPADRQFWWNCRFKIFWPPGQKLDLTADVLLAHAVVSPVIDEFIEHISYWRFHRRAARDEAGHQFSFLFYTDPHTAKQVFDKIQQSSILKEAIKHEIIESIRVDNTQKPSRAEVKDKSDRKWSLSMQKSWPYYIMGVSSLWLALINEATLGKAAEGDDVTSLLEYYRQIDAQVTSIWYREGQHALLHHLNAIFGYSPLLIRKQMRF
jgi:hypothetical protein